MSQWKMYRHKRGIKLLGDMAGAKAGADARTEVRYAVWCDDKGEPIVHSGEFLAPQSGRYYHQPVVAILCPRNIRFTPGGADEDLDPTQWASSTLPADRFSELYCSLG